MVMRTCGGSADSDGGREVEMENKSTEETWTDLETVSRCQKSS